MRFVVGRDNEVIAYAADKLGHSLAPSAFIAFGVVATNDLGGELHGAVVLSGWNGANIDITIYMPGQLKRNLIRDCYRYVFDHCGCLRMSARTMRSNEVMRKLLPRLGFHYEYTQKYFFGPTKAEDGLSFVLTRDAAQKWM